MELPNQNRSITNRSQIKETITDFVTSTANQSSIERSSNDSFVMQQSDSIENIQGNNVDQESQMNRSTHSMQEAGSPETYTSIIALYASIVQ